MFLTGKKKHTHTIKDRKEKKGNIRILSRFWNLRPIRLLAGGHQFAVKYSFDQDSFTWHTSAFCTATFSSSLSHFQGRDPSEICVYWAPNAPLRVTQPRILLELYYCDKSFTSVFLGKSCILLSDNLGSCSHLFRGINLLKSLFVQWSTDASVHQPIQPFVHLFIHSSMPQY